MTEAKTVRELVKAIKTGTKEKTKGYETSATVQRIEDGIAWVHIPGGVDETPVKMTINAKVGDTVQVRVSGGRATLTGNATSPPTDDATADKALSNANSAMQSARNAQISANAAEQAAQTAEAAAQDAVETAESVHDIAVQAQTDAETAKANAQTAITNAAAAQSSADAAASAASQAQTEATAAGTAAANASEYAARALGNLSTVQNVTETLNWITQHGQMTPTTDTALDPTHVYFVQDSTGDYVVGGVHYAVVTEPNASDLSTYYELSIDQSLNNYVATHLVVTGEGLWIIPDAGGNKVLIATGQGNTYTSAGTYIIGKANNADTVLASFTQSGAVLGSKDKANAEIDYHSIRFNDKGQNKFFEVLDLRNSEGYATLTEPFIGDGSSLFFRVSLPIKNVLSVKNNNTLISDSDYAVDQYGVTFLTAPLDGDSIEITYTSTSNQATSLTYGNRKNGSTEGAGSIALGFDVVASGPKSYAEGIGTIASNLGSHAEGSYASFNGVEKITEASGLVSHAEGQGCTASGDASHAEGMVTVASGYYSHAEGLQTVADGYVSHAEGSDTHAEGFYSHAEGNYSHAEGNYSHAEGSNTYAKGNYSHAQNQYTIAGYSGQTAIGRYNDNQTDTAFEIGNGTNATRSNAFTVDWNGDMKLQLKTTEALYNAISNLGWTSEVIE